MSVAEKLIAEGRVEGRVEGQKKGAWIGRIQAFEEFLSQPITSSEVLSELTIDELESRHQVLHGEYRLRFKS